ncbi:MAG: hypothetical protein GY821_09455, partial [Gammaproteobacteria bacterium]|nr:hypothetical protein [Gammaproteobacteria bacterium]
MANDSGQISIQRLSECSEKIEERLATTNTKMEKIVTDVRELGHVVDHDIMKRDQESARFSQQLLEEDKTTDKFKNEMTPSQNCRQFTTSEPSCSKDCRRLTPTEKIVDRFKKLNPALNIFKAEKHTLRSNTEALVMEPYVEALPIQCVPVPSITVHVEGYPLKVVVDTGAGPSLVVPERIGNMILAKKYATLGEMHQAIIPPLGKVQIASCTGGDVPIVGQAIVNMRIGELKFPTPMLIMKTDHERAECLLGV